jgi:hypothetical protein
VDVVYQIMNNNEAEILSVKFCTFSINKTSSLVSFCQCEVTYRKYALKQGNHIDVRFIKYDIQGVVLKCSEILPTRLFDNVED